MLNEIQEKYAVVSNLKINCSNNTSNNTLEDKICMLSGSSGKGCEIRRSTRGSFFIPA